MKYCTVLHHHSVIPDAFQALSDLHSGGLLGESCKTTLNAEASQAAAQGHQLPPPRADTLFTESW